MASSFKTWWVEAWRRVRRGEWRRASPAPGPVAGDPPASQARPEVPPAAPLAPASPTAASAEPLPPHLEAVPAPEPSAPLAPVSQPGASPAARPRSGGKLLSGEFVHSQGRADYLLFVPSGWQDQRMPLVLMLHGCTQDPEDFARGTRMNALAQALGVLVLYPAQTGSANPARCWNWFSRRHQKRELGEPALLAALTQSVVATYGADPQRVYAAGLSAGGAMAAVLGQTWPDVFAAIGVHSGLAYAAAGDVMGAMAVMRHGPGTGQPASPAALPVIVFHGDADSTVHPDNGEQLIAAVRGQAAPAEVVEGVSDLGQGYTRRVYADSASGLAAEHWLLHGAGHAWAGGHGDGSFTDPAGPDASREMLRFFLDHPKPARH